MFYRWLLWSSVSFFAIVLGVFVGMIGGMLIGTLLDNLGQNGMFGWTIITVAGGIILGIGSALGAGQGLVLQQYQLRWHEWFWATIAGLILGTGLTYALSDPMLSWDGTLIPWLERTLGLPSAETIHVALMGAMLGAILGICQWLPLRTAVQHAIWWVPASALSVAAAVAVGTAMQAQMERGSLIWGSLIVGVSIYAMVISVVFAWLAQNPTNHTNPRTSS